MPLAPDSPGQLAPHHKRTVALTITVTLVVLALVTGLGVVLLYRHLDDKIQAGGRIHHHAKMSHADTPTSALNILVMGSDTRDCRGCGIDNQKGENGSDTTILIHVRSGRRSAYGISIPRDTLVDRPACHPEGKPVVPAQKDVMWNAAFSVGGPECTVEQVEAVTGIRIDDYITVNFGGFKDMVDAVGGVQVCLPQAVDDTKAHIHLPAGTQTLDGTKALAYVRERKAIGDGSDIGRMKRQQSFVASLIKKVVSAGTLSRPDRLYRFANALAGSIQTSPDLASPGALVELANSLRHAELTHIRFITAPNVAFPENSPNWGRLEFTPATARLWKRVIADKPLGRFGRGAISANKPKGNKSDAAAAGLCG